MIGTRKQFCVFMCVCLHVVVTQQWESAKEHQEMVRHRKVTESSRMVTIFVVSNTGNMEFTGVIDVEGSTGDNQLRAHTPKHQEFKEGFVRTDNEAMIQGWVIPTRHNGNRAWIKHVEVNDMDWKIETAAVKVRHWPDQVLRCNAGEIIKENSGMLIHWLRKHSAPPRMCDDKDLCEKVHRKLMMQMTEEHLKETKHQNMRVRVMGGECQVNRHLEKLSQEKNHARLMEFEEACQQLNKLRAVAKDKESMRCDKPSNARALVRSMWKR